VLSMRENLGKGGPAGYTADTIGEDILMNDDIIAFMDSRCE